MCGRDRKFIRQLAEQVSWQAGRQAYKEGVWIARKECGVVDGTHPVQGVVHWQALLNAAKNLQVP
jgi:hypothetical protein